MRFDSEVYISLFCFSFERLCTCLQFYCKYWLLSTRNIKCYIPSLYINFKTELDLGPGAPI
jgi:hypothetical protein